MYKSARRIISVLIIAAMLAGTSFSGVALALDAQDISIKVSQYDFLDVVLTLGRTDSDVSAVQDDLEAALTARGVPAGKIKITAVESSEVSAGNTSEGWEIYDHTNFNDSSVIPYYRPYYNDSFAGDVYGPGYEPQWNVSNHIQVDISGGQTNIDFRGYGAPAYKDFMYMPNTEFGKKKFDFTIQEGYFYDALDGAGFLFNTSMTPSTDLANRYMSGYLLFFNYPSTGSTPVIQLYKFENIDVNAFHNHASTKIESYAGFTRLASSTLPGAETTRVVSIEAGAESVTMWYNGTHVNWSLTSGGTSTEVVLPTDFGAYGFGPLTGYSSHSCARPTLFTFLNVQMTKESSKRFSEVIREPEWRSESKRFIINAEDEAVADFSDPQALGEILARLGNENIHYLGWGRDEADGNAFIAKNDNKGTFVDKDSVTTYAGQIAALADYISDEYHDSVVNDTEYLIYGKPSAIAITPESEQTNTADADWPSGKWRVEQDESYYDNATGVVPYDGFYLNNLDISFTETGKYEIYYQDEIVKTVYVHRKPVASFGISVDGSYNVSITNNAYDPDFETDPGRGIASQTWQYRETASAVWTQGQPSSFEADKNYIVRQIVTDNYGIASDPYYRYVSTEDTADSEPMAEFKVTPGRLLTYVSETVSYNDTSYDPQGETITDRLWKVYSDGSEVYSGAAPKTDFTGAGAGSYKITLKARNASGVWSQEVARYLTVVRDTTAPAVECNTPSGDYSEPRTVRLDFDDETGGSGFSHRFAAVKNSDVPPSTDEEWGSMGTNSAYSITLDTLGANYVHYKAYDYAGNTTTGVFGPFTFADISAPSEPAVTVMPEHTDGNWVNGYVTVTASGSTDDFTPSEDLVYEVSDDGLAYTAGGVRTFTDVTGTYTVYFRVTDASGNSTVATKTVKIDNTVPSVPNIAMVSGGKDYAAGTWANQNVSITLFGSAETDSGIANYQYKIGNGSWQDGDEYTFGDSGTYTLLYRCLDNAGNLSAAGSKNIKVDIDAPEPFSITASSTMIDSIHISAAATDTHSGIAGYRVFNGESWSGWKTAVNETLTGYTRGQEVTIKVEAKDVAGNVRMAEAAISTLQNTAPLCADDKYTMKEDSLRTALNVLANDTDADTGRADGDALSVASISPLSRASAGKLSLTEGEIFFTPAQDYNGTVTFSYKATDTKGATDTGIVTVTVSAVNDAPSAYPDSITTSEDKEIVFNPLSNDEDIDSAIYIKEIGDASHGTAARSANGLKYTPDKDYNGSDSFTYTITDGQYSAMTTVRVTVKSVNDAPAAFADSANTYYMQPVSVDVLANDTDADGDTLNITAVSAPSGGSAVIQGGKISYTPADGFTGTDTFSYTVTDKAAQATAQVTVVVAYPEFYNDKTTIFNFGGTDTRGTDSGGSSEPGGEGTGESGTGGTGGGDMAIVSQPTGGTVTTLGGSAYYTPDEGTSGIDTYRIIVDNGTGDVEYQVITNTDESTGETTTLGYGVPLSDEGFASQGNEIRIPLADYLGENYDGDSTITISGQPVNGSVEIIDGYLVYTPSEGYNGLDAVVFTISTGDEQIPYAATFDVEGTDEALLSVWCIIGWVAAALLLTLNYIRHRDYFTGKKAKTIIYTAIGAALCVLLCWLRVYTGYYISAAIMAAYIAGAWLYTGYIQKKRRKTREIML